MTRNIPALWTATAARTSRDSRKDHDDITRSDAHPVQRGCERFQNL
jgi:hypothetical protein